MTSASTRVSGVLLLYLALVLPALCSAQSVRIVYAEQYRPYCWEDEQGIGGLEVDLAEELFRKRLGLEIKHQVLPWARAQADVASGSADFFFAVDTLERQQFSQAVGDRLINWHASAFVRKSEVTAYTPKMLSVDQLCNAKVGAVRGNSWAKRYLACAAISPSNSPQSLVRMLQMKRTDVIIDDALVLRDVARQRNLESEIHEIAISEGAAVINLRIGHRSKYQYLVPKLASAISAMRADHTLSRIVSRYGNSAAP